MQIPFGQPSLGAREARAVMRALRTNRTVGNGELCRRVEGQLCALTGAPHALMTPNATQAFELFLHLDDPRVVGGLQPLVGPGDEVILPSFSYVSMANAVCARGATPVFVEIERETLGLDPAAVRAAITERTKLVMPVHYGGMACALPELLAVCAERGVALFEDAAQAIGSTFEGRHLGTFGMGACLSFHATKNVISGEGGALLLNSDEALGALEIAHEKGTNRSAFLRGEVDKYTWVGSGGSFVLSDLLAALLGVQLERIDELTARRREIWDLYQAGTEWIEDAGLAFRCVPRAGCEHNAHIWWMVMESQELADRVLEGLRRRGVQATFHYQALHASPFAKAHLGCAELDLPLTKSVSECIVRLPVSSSLNRSKAERVLKDLRAVV